MKSRIAATFVVALASTALAQAGPAEDAQAAVKKLADAPNYSWTSTTVNGGGGGGGGGFGGGPITGVAEKGGAAVITRQTQNGARQTVIKGERRVAQTQNGWMTAEEIAAAGAGGGRGMGGGAGLNLATAASELEVLVGAATDFKSADGVITATVGSEAVAARLTFGRGGRGGGGGQAAAPRNAGGSLKLWLQDGAVAKYEFNLKGAISGRDGQEFNIDRTTTVEIKDVGTTKVEIPAEAQAKLGG